MRRLPHVELAFAGDQSFSQQNLHAVLGALFNERGGLGHQNLADHLRIINENDIAPAQLVMRDGSEGLRQMFKQQDWVSRPKKAPE